MNPKLNLWSDYFNKHNNKTFKLSNIHNAFKLVKFNSSVYNYYKYQNIREVFNEMGTLKIMNVKTRE